VRDLIKDRFDLHKGFQGFLDFWPQFRGDDYLAQAPTSEPD
jgi:hypothetical protein